MNKEVEEAKKILEEWNRIEEIILRDNKIEDRKPYLERKHAIETILNYIKELEKQLVNYKSCINETNTQAKERWWSR